NVTPQPPQISTLFPYTTLFRSEGTNETIRRGGALAREGAVMVKVAKSNQDMRFDVPIIGVETIRVAREAGLRVIAVEAGKTLFLQPDAIANVAGAASISIVGR